MLILLRVERQEVHADLEEGDVAQDVVPERLVLCPKPQAVRWLVQDATRVARAAPTSAEPEASFAHSRAVDAVILVPVVVVGAEPDVEQRQQTVLGSVGEGSVEVEPVVRRLVQHFEVLVQQEVRRRVLHLHVHSHFVGMVRGQGVDLHITGGQLVHFFGKVCVLISCFSLFCSFVCCLFWCWRCCCCFGALVVFVLFCFS